MSDESMLAIQSQAIKEAVYELRDHGVTQYDILVATPGGNYSRAASGGLLFDGTLRDK